MDLTPAQQESINSLLRILGGSALLGGAVRSGYGVLRNANRVYEPPAAPKPLIVDMPYAAREAPPLTEIPIPKKMQKVAAEPGRLTIDSPELHRPFVAPPAPPAGILGRGAAERFGEDGVPLAPASGNAVWNRRLMTLPVPNPIVWARDGGLSPGGPVRATPNADVRVKDVIDKIPIGRAASTVRATLNAEQNHKDFRTIKNNAEKAAWSWDSFWKDIKSVLPDSPPAAGFPNAQGPTEVPLHGFAAPATAAAGLGGGYMLADRLLRAADRRNARKDLEAAQAEYQQAIMNRVTGGQPDKVAADLTKMAADRTPDDPDLRRAKAALDALYARVKAAKPDESHVGWNAIKSFLYPGSMLGPEGFWTNLTLAGTGAALGGFAGYNAARNSEEAATVRSKIKALDRENAKKIPAPVVARLVPVAPDKI